MEEDQSFINFDPNDFIIRISPIMENDEWNGEINVGQVSAGENTLKDTDYAHLSVLTEMLICAIPLIEKDDNIRKELYRLAEEQFGEDRPRVTKREGNVLNVNF
jgi:DNA-binding transcriptional ArsR family regulator